MGWWRASKLKLNPDKMPVLLEESQSSLGDGPKLTLVAVALTPSQSVGAFSWTQVISYSGGGSSLFPT